VQSATVASGLTTIVRVGSGAQPAPQTLNYCGVYPYVSQAINVTNNNTASAVTLVQFGDIEFIDVDDYPQEMQLPNVTLNSTSTTPLVFIIVLQCSYNYTTPTNLNATYIYIIDPVGTFVFHSIAAAACS
jgi:hypothetical protein